MKEQIDKYLEYLLYQKNYSNSTIEGYKDNLNIYSIYLNIENLSYDEITYQDIRPFFNYLSDKKYSKSSIARIVSSVRGFYKYLVKEEIVNDNPFLLVSAPKKDLKLPKFLYSNELESMFLIPDMNNPKGIRDRLILEILYATGMRVSELINIKLNDIDFKNKQIKVMGKGSKERYVFFGDYANKYLNLYINNARNELIKTPNEYLLINNKETKLSDRGIRVIINEIIKKSTLDLNVSPHTLRHTFATHLLNEGCDILSVQELLGHSSLKATQVYTHVTDEKLRDVYLHTHPRSNKKL